jgi:hypothetical protein
MGGNVAYKLELLDTLKIRYVFHVSLLKPYRASSNVQPPLPPTLEEDDELPYEIERVLAHEVRGNSTKSQKYYLIKWLGYGLEHNSWKPEKNLNLEVFKEYWDTVACSQTWLTQKEGVESISVPKKKKTKNFKKQKVKP